MTSFPSFLALAMLSFAWLAQSPEAFAAQKDLRLVAGLGFSFTDSDDTDTKNGDGIGSFAEAEMVVKVASWFSPRVYGGLVMTWPNRESCGLEVRPCDVSAKLAFVGGKLHLMAPIPYVGPFLEFGLGVSAGAISTRVGTQYDRSHTGFMFHVPVTLGLALGRSHAFELSFSYLYHPSYGHVNGALALGFVFPL